MAVPMERYIKVECRIPGCDAGFMFAADPVMEPGAIVEFANELYLSGHFRLAHRDHKGDAVYSITGPGLRGSGEALLTPKSFAQLEDELERLDRRFNALPPFPKI